MSDFPARSFKWTEIMSLIIENVKEFDSRSLGQELDQLRQFACQRYKANPEIEQRFKEYWKSEMEMFAILVQMFGEP